MLLGARLGWDSRPDKARGSARYHPQVNLNVYTGLLSKKVAQMTPVSSRSQYVTRAFSATALSASLHFRLAVSMSVIQSWRSRAELARSIILSPPRGYATEIWKDSSSATLHELDHKEGVVNRDTYLYALVPLLRESPTTELAKPD